MSVGSGIVLIQGGRVLDLDGDIDQPGEADILVVDGRIAAVEAGLGPRLVRGEPHPALGGRRIGEILHAKDRLVVPGFVNAHYHSHDVLLKGCFETIPLELWVLNALPPSYPKRSKDEIRVRTLLGALECLRGGITTVQDLATLFPYDEEHLDTALAAYDSVGLRVVFALQVADVVGAKSIPFWDEVVPAEMRTALSGAVEPFGKNFDLIGLVEGSMKARRGRHDLISWALGPTSPERCSEAFLAQLGDLSRRENVPIYTHIYESKAMTLIARQHWERDGGSLIRYMDRAGILGPKLSLAHSVWLLREEIEKLAETGTNVVLNPVGNLKTKSGVAPIRPLHEYGVNVALGSDNCSCSDAQNMFQAMKMFTSLAAVSEPDPGPPTALDALRAATLNGARTAGLDGRVGALKPGMAADLSIIDLRDPSFVPLNSAARQLVFTESGRAVETVMVAGRVVIRDRRATTIDEDALRGEVEGIMKVLRKDIDAVTARNMKMYDYLIEAHRRTWAEDVGTNRYVGNGSYWP